MEHHYTSIIQRGVIFWRRSILTLCFAFLCISLFSQEYSGDYNELSDDMLKRALEMKTYEQDTSASALLLFDQGKVRVFPAGTNLNYLRRIKIISNSAYADWTSVSLYVRKLGFTKIHGFSANLENGEIIKTEIGEAQIFKTSYNRNWDKYTFTVPNVRVGTVIEYTWKTTFDFHFLPDWKFQHSIPVLWSEYSLENPVISFRSDVLGLLKTNYEAPSGKKPHRWTVENAPAFRTEPFMPHVDRYRSQLKLWSQARSWEEEVKPLLLYDYFRIRPVGYDVLHPIAKEIRGRTSGEPRELIKNLVEYVKSKVSWNGVCDNSSDELSDVLKQARGSSGDINIMLYALFVKAGIKVNPVFISTRDNGPVYEDIPAFDQFDDVICQVIIESDTLYLDATEQYLRYDALPLRCLNERGLCVPKKTAPYWVNIKPQFKNKMTVDADFVLQESGELNGKLKITTDGYSSQTVRQKYFEDKEKYYLSSIDAGWQVNEMRYENEKELEKPFIESYDVTITTHADIAGNTIYINPFLALVEESNPFKAGTRTFPIEYDLPEDKMFVGKIAIPEGYTVLELPKNQVMMTQGAGIKCAFSFSQTGNLIHILTRLQVNRTLFGPDEYKDVKEFYALVIAKKAEQIVLRKK